jgi:xanthine dehydrogenase accessory factor
MSEITALLETLLADVDAGRNVGLCAVVRTKGSAPQAPGAAMLIRSDFSTCGTLGGGCVEAEVKRRAFKHLQDGESTLLDFILDHHYGWDDGLICGGRMFVGMQTVTPQNVGPIRQAITAAHRRESAIVPIRVDHDGIVEEYRIQLTVPPTLLIAGAGHVGQAVARLAVDLDFDVVVIDDRADLASTDRFDPRVVLRIGDIAEHLRSSPPNDSSYVVIVTRGHQHDHQALDAVVRSDASYIGLIGSRRKSKMIMDDLRAAGVTHEQLDRVHTPIGLPIGGVTVNEIAISIVAELIAHRRKNRAPIVEGPFVISAPTDADTNHKP